MKRSFLLILALFYLSIAMAQQPQQFNFTHFSTASGLLSNQVNTVVQDDKGYIWTGSTDGLQRFDGTRYKTFQHNSKDPGSLPSNPIFQLLVDKKKNLWVLMNDGRIGIFNTSKFTFRETAVKYKDKIHLPSAIKLLITDEEGNLFLLIRGSEILTLDPKSNEFSTAHNFFKLKNNMAIGGFIHQPGTKKYWIVIEGGSLAVYNHATRKISYPDENVEKEPLVDQVKGMHPYHLFFDSKARLWFITWGPGYPFAHCHEANSGKPLIVKTAFTGSVKSYYELNGFFEQNDGTIWIYGLRVLAKFLEQDKIFQFVHNGYLNERSISYERVSSLFEDQENNTWVSTDNNGLYRFNPSGEYFTNVEHLNRHEGVMGTGSALSFMHTRWGTLLVGNWGDGVYHYDLNLKPLPTNIKGMDNKGGPFAWNMCASRDSNTLWISSQPGIYAIDQSKRSVKYYNPTLLSTKTMRQIAEDQQGNLWLGMQGIGLFKWTIGLEKRTYDEKNLKRVPGMPVVQINKIFVDSRGMVWVGTAFNGLYVIDPNNDKILLHFHDKEPGALKLPETGISSILEYDDSLMIFTTSTRLLLYNRYTMRSTLMNSSQFLSGYIASMEKDKAGYLWLSTSNGLYRINVRKNLYVAFNRSDGIENDHFILAASHQLPDGRMLFGSTTQFVIFDPAKVQVGSDFPKITITDFKVMNRSMDVDSLTQLKQIELPHQRNSLVIEFSTLSSKTAHVIRYKLDNLDKEWKTADKTNQAIYSYIPPGSYTLLLQTMNVEGVESTELTRLSIKILPPFWQTWWFYGLLALSGAVLLYLVDRERLKRKEAIQKTRSDIAGNLHQEVNSALNNINILSEIARIKADKDIEKSKEYIEQIHRKSHHMIIAMDDMLWSIDPENDSMKKTVERMREYIDALNQRHGSQIQLLVDEKVNALKLDMQFRHEAFILFKDSIRGLVDAGAGDGSIHVALEKNLLLYTIQFTTKHCDLQMLNNLLQSQEMAKRVDAIKASLKVEMGKSNAVLMLKVPVN